jgi:hypothetical protein
MSDYTLADVRAAVGGLYIRVDCLSGGRRGKLPACLAQYDGLNDLFTTYSSPSLLSHSM